MDKEYLKDEEKTRQKILQGFWGWKLHFILYDQGVVYHVEYGEVAIPMILFSRLEL